MQFQVKKGKRMERSSFLKSIDACEKCENSDFQNHVMTRQMTEGNAQCASNSMSEKFAITLRNQISLKGAKFSLVENHPLLKYFNFFGKKLWSCFSDTLCIALVHWSTLTHFPGSWWHCCQKLLGLEVCTWYRSPHLQAIWDQVALGSEWWHTSTARHYSRNGSHHRPPFERGPRRKSRRHLFLWSDIVSDRSIRYRHFPAREGSNNSEAVAKRQWKSPCWPCACNEYLKRQKRLSWANNRTD